MIVPISNNFLRTASRSVRLSHQQIKYSSEKKKEDKPQPEIPKNELEGMFAAQNQDNHNKMYDKKPFKMLLEAGKKYSWCFCGQSHGQPLCDGTHKNVFLKITQKPIRFSVKETKEYWLCNCKQTSNRPFCDGTHMRKDIQEKKFQM